MDDKVKKGRHTFGETVPNRKLSEAQARQIMQLRRDGTKQRVIADTMGIALHLVKDVSRGLTWKHLRGCDV
ncbi:MAG: hypothetical protein OEY69_00025 [Candidatus Krumholzibacteria bacterium]|nr:hypothetical protein [Candidatus Krumholzibacteria bacterium]